MIHHLRVLCMLLAGSAAAARSSGNNFYYYIDQFLRIVFTTGGFSGAMYLLFVFTYFITMTASVDKQTKQRRVDKKNTHRHTHE